MERTFEELLVEQCAPTLVGVKPASLFRYQAACRLDPSNPEYTAALRNLQRSAGGAMPGNPYGNNAPYGAQTVTCSCCDMCAAMACMDMCCNCGGGC